MKDIMIRLVAKLTSWCENDPLATVQEGHLKVEAMRSLLGQGCVLQEGSNVHNKGWRMECIDGEIKVDLVVTEAHNTKPDLRILKPFTASIELKVRPDYGSLAQARSSQFEKDLRNVARGEAEALVVAFGPSGYNAMRGEKTSPKGRKPKFILETLLPDPASIPTGDVTVTEGYHDGVQFVVCCGKACNDRIVAAVCSIDAWNRDRA